jgi:dTDP-4-dehydrorhamnose reductase
MRIVLTGATGQLGSCLLEELTGAGHRVVAWSRRPAAERCGVLIHPVDLTSEQTVLSALNEAKPDVIVHVAAISAADEVRNDPARGHAVNVEGTRTLARWCRERGRRLLFTSTDLVFDGKRSWYREQDEPRPILAYGRTKAQAELAVLDLPDGLVARLSLLYRPTRSGRQSFFERAMAGFRAGQPQWFFSDEYRTPLDYKTAARLLARLVEANVQGVVHVAGRERLSRFELMSRIAAALGIDPTLVRANQMADVALAEPRPVDVSLDTSRLASILPDVERPPVEIAILAFRNHVLVMEPVVVPRCGGGSCRPAGPRESGPGRQRIDRGSRDSAACCSAARRRRPRRAGA